MALAERLCKSGSPRHIQSTKRKEIEELLVKWQPEIEAGKLQECL